jgi:serine/threonine protein kinase
MFDQRNTITYNLEDGEELKEGAAYKFVDPTTRKPIVVKIISTYGDFNDQYLVNEFKKFALLSSEPEICNVYFLATANDNLKSHLCYVMDYIPGHTIDDLTEAGHIINFQECIDIIIQLIVAIEKSHHYDIFHGDLHKGNILVNNMGYVKVIDFLFYEPKKTEFFFQKDIKDLASIVSDLSNICNVDFQFLARYLHDLNSLNGVSRELGRISDFLFELSLLEDQYLEVVVSILTELSTQKFNKYFHMAIEELELPESTILAISNKEKQLATQDSSGLVKNKFISVMIKEMTKNIDLELQRLLWIHELNGLFAYTFSVFNKSQILDSGYYLRLNIQPSYRLVLLSKVFYKMKFVSVENLRDFSSIIYDELS